MYSLGIDARMVNSSGIGRYLRGILSQIDFHNYILFLNKEVKYSDFLSKSDIEQYSVEIKSGIYSIQEQFEIAYKIPKQTNVFWSPHYNIPALWGGHIISTVHDVAHLALTDIFGSMTKQAYAKLMFQMVAKRTSKIICVSEFTKKELQKHTGVNEDKIEVIYNGLDPIWEKVKKEIMPNDKPYLLYVGNIKPHKNLKTLIKAYSKINDKIPHDLVLVGEREGFITGDDEVAQLVHKSEGRIKFTGFVDEDTLKQYYAHAETFIFPSFYEGFGYPPLEAMACGAPVIASNAASIPEVCGDAAEYFNPSSIDELISQMEKVLFAEELKKEMIAKGRLQVKKFSLAETAKKTQNLLKEFA